MKQKLRLMGLLCPKSSYYNMQSPILLLAICTLNMCLEARAQRPESSGPVLSGIVTDTVEAAISGATIIVKGTNARTISGRDGRFTLYAPQQSGTLVISYLGHQTIQEKFSEGNIGPYHFTLVPTENLLEEVEVSTGYQTISKERATGSFEVVDNKLFNRGISTNVMDRLDGLVAGANFDLTKSYRWRDQGYFLPQVTYMMQVRGQNTFTGEIRPIIVLDNVIYEGDPRNINPNDVKDIHVLKDAAATSIWGTQAGNGVVVITTKRPSETGKPSIGFVSNFTHVAKPDLYALREMSSSDFIDYEQWLFDKGFYDGMINDTWSYPTVSPVVELLNSVREGDLEMDVAQRQIDGFRDKDVRQDYLNHVYRPQALQQYALTINGGNQSAGYLLSAGYDNNKLQLVTSNNDRLTLRSAVNVNLTEKLSLKASISYAKSRANSNGTFSPIAYGTLYSGGGKSNWPYLRLVDDEGNPALVDAVAYRKLYRDTAGNGNLLNWQYRPLAELDQSRQHIAVQDILMSGDLGYAFTPNWSAVLLYTYQKGNTEIEDWHGVGSYAMRENINIYSQWDDNGVRQRPYPLGDRMDRMYETKQSHTLRLQAKYAGRWNDDQELNAIIGAEQRQITTTNNGNTLLGYNRQNLTYQPVDFAGYYPLYNQAFGGQRIPNVAEFYMDDLLNRYLSAYANASFTYRNRYILSGSFRQDASNVFGQRSNQRWTPLWSAGAAWKLSDEPFYRVSWLPSLKLRLTYGYSGQAITTQAAIPIIYYQGTSALTGLPQASITTPANPDLRWQKTATLNGAVDFATRNNRISGSVEWYRKWSKDLLSRSPVDPTTGFNSLTVNAGSIAGKGLDITINTENIRTPDFAWQSTWLSNYNRNIVTDYYAAPLYARDYVLSGNTLNPVKGRDLNGLYALPFAGLNPETGDPMGYLDGEESMDYRNILLGTPESLLYFGSSIPAHVATLRNSFSYRSWSISVNLQAKLGYHFFRNGFSDHSAATYWQTHRDYALRWQKPGDEAFTHVPSLSYPLNSNRSEFYKRSEVLVEKGDHIRIQDVAISYAMSQFAGFKNVQINAYCSNLNILIWKATKLDIDPLYENALPYPLSISIGIRANL